VVQLLFAGFSYREIGENLGISLSTVRAHLHSAYRTLQVKSRAQAVAKILRQSCTDHNEPGQLGLSNLCKLTISRRK
jgi:DNA-binding NarL/FixJ family response regulator